MIHPDIPAEMIRTELESDFVGPAVQVPSDKPNIADRVSAARVDAGLNDDAAPNTETRGVVIPSETTNISKGLDDDVDPYVVRDIGEENIPGLTCGYDSDDDNSNGDADSVGDDEPVEEPTVQRTRSRRANRNPNRLNPTMTGKSYGNSHNVGVISPW